MFFQPQNNTSALMLFLMSIISLVPTMLFWYCTYWIPKKFGRLSTTLFRSRKLNIDNHHESIINSESDYHGEDVSQISQPLITHHSSKRVTNGVPYFNVGNTLDDPDDEDSKELDSSPLKRDIKVQSFKNSFEECIKSNFEKSVNEKTPTSLRPSKSRSRVPQNMRSIAFPSEEFGD